MSNTLLTGAAVAAIPGVGSVPEERYALQINPASGAGAYTFAHGLPYTPLTVSIQPVTTEGGSILTASFVPAGTTSTVIEVQVSGSGLFNVYFG